MKDYRTWWRKSGLGYGYVLGRFPKGFDIAFLYGDNGGFINGDCITEQIWAIKKGLA